MCYIAHSSYIKQLSKLPKSTKVKSHGKNVCDVIIVHVISGDAQTNRQTNRCRTINSTLRTSQTTCFAHGQLVIFHQKFIVAIIHGCKITVQVDQRLQLSIIHIPIHGCSLFCIESHTKSGASTLEEYMNFVLYRILRTYITL